MLNDNLYAKHVLPLFWDDDPVIHKESLDCRIKRLMNKFCDSIENVIGLFKFLEWIRNSFCLWQKLSEKSQRIRASCWWL